MMIGYFNYVPHWRITAILAPGRSASKRLRDRADQEGRLLDARFGRRTRSLPEPGAAPGPHARGPGEGPGGVGGV